MYKSEMSYYPSYIERDAILKMDPNIKVKDIVAYVYEEFLNKIPITLKEGRSPVCRRLCTSAQCRCRAVVCREVYPRIREKLQVPFYVVGSKVTEEIKALEQPGNGIIIKGFVSEEELAELYETCRVVVVPLGSGAGVKGKVIEALYNGAPIVTTSIGAEGIAGAEDVMEITDEATDFAETVVSLYQDPEKCKEISKKTQVYVREHHSIDAAWKVIEEDFQ